MSPIDFKKSANTCCAVVVPSTKPWMPFVNELPTASPIPCDTRTATDSRSFSCVCADAMNSCIGDAAATVAAVYV